MRSLGALNDGRVNARVERSRAAGSVLAQLADHYETRGALTAPLAVRLDGRPTHAVRFDRTDRSRSEGPGP